MITISHTFQYKIVLKIFKSSNHLSKQSDNMPMAWREPEHCHLGSHFSYEENKNIHIRYSTNLQMFKLEMTGIVLAICECIIPSVET